MKLDMGKAWNDAMALLQSNMGLVATILALFYFLPALAFALLFPELANPTPPDIPPDAAPEAMYQAMVGFLQAQYAMSWPYLLGITLLQYAGTLCVLALFSDRSNPTVGEAISTGLRGTPSYLISVLLYGLGIGVVIGLVMGLAFAVFPILGVLLMIPAIILLVYISVKFLFIPTVIAMEGELNPVAVLKRSWALTKGNSLRIFAFVLVLFVVAILAALVISLILTTVLSIFGGAIASIGVAIIDALVGAVLGGLLLVVLAAMHRQLTGSGNTDVFE